MHTGFCLVFSLDSDLVKLPDVMDVLPAWGN